MFQDRIQNIKDHVSIFDVLTHYGVELSRGKGHEQQVKCPFHGHRGDLRPSARAYESSQKFYCFYCGFALDVISFVKEYEGINFLRALNYLEYNFNVPKLSVQRIQDDLYKTLNKKSRDFDENALLGLYEYCEKLIIKNKKKFTVKSYCKLFLLLESTLCKLRDSIVTGEEAFDQFTKIRYAVESK